MTISENLLNRIGDGRVRVKPDIARIDGLRVVFTDGSSEAVDAIICCTSYSATFPFLDPALFATPDNQVRLYQQIFHPQQPGLCFVGLFQAIAWGFLPLYEGQGQLIAAYLAGRYALPGREAMGRAIERAAASTARRFVHSPRNHYMLNGPIALSAWRAELTRGRRRATRSSTQHIPVNQD